jgi:hypothetical protein
MSSSLSESEPGDTKAEVKKRKDTKPTEQSRNEPETTLALAAEVFERSNSEMVVV